MNRTMTLLATLALATLAACGHGQSEQVSSIPVSEQRAQETRRDPLRRLDLMENMHRQIVYKTRGMPDDRYRQVVRPRLAMQLQATGLDAGDAERVLRDVDYTRGLRAGR